MPTLCWDASSVTKRYVPEKGTPTVLEIWKQPLHLPMLFTFPGYAEVYAILRRRFNSGLLASDEFDAARLKLRRELLYSSAFLYLPINEDTVLASLDLIDRHNLNSSDAAILAAYLDYRSFLTPSDPPAVLVASDHRLLRAARAEGIPAIDPETVPAADVPALLAGL